MILAAVVPRHSISSSAIGGTEHAAYSVHCCLIYPACMLLSSSYICILNVSKVSARLGDTDDYKGLYQKAHNLYECVERRLCKQPGLQLVRDRCRNNYSGVLKIC